MKAVLVVGSNCGNKRSNVEAAIYFLKKNSRLIDRSDIYESRDFLGSGKTYLNCVVILETRCSEDYFNRQLKEFEIVCGRDSSAKERGDVPIDLDIVIWNSEIRRPKDYYAEFFRNGYDAMKKI